MGSDRATPEGVGQRKRTRMPERAVGALSFPYAQDGRKRDGLSPEAGRVAMVALLVAAVAAIAGVTAATMVSDWVSPAHREAAIAQQFAQTRPPAEPNVNPQATMVQALTETGDAKAHQTAASAALVKTAAVSAQETATRVKAVALTRIAAAPATAVEDAGTAMATVAEPIACEALDFPSEGLMDKKRMRKMARFSQMASTVARMAVQDSGIVLESLDTSRVGCVIGSAGGDYENLEAQHATLLQKGPGHGSPFAIPKIICNMASSNAAIDLGLHGPNVAVLSACATGAHSIGTAMDFLTLGHADVMIAGGAEAAISPLTVDSYDSMTVLSHRNDEPQ